MRDRDNTSVVTNGPKLFQTLGLLCRNNITVKSQGVEDIPGARLPAGLRDGGAGGGLAGAGAPPPPPPPIG